VSLPLSAIGVCQGGRGAGGLKGAWSRPFTTISRNNSVGSFRISSGTIKLTICGRVPKRHRAKCAYNMVHPRGFEWERGRRAVGVAGRNRGNVLSQPHWRPSHVHVAFCQTKSGFKSLSGLKLPHPARRPLAVLQLAKEKEKKLGVKNETD